VSARRSGFDVVPSPWDEAPSRPALPPAGSRLDHLRGRDDAPLLPHQCERLAQRAGLGIARAGGTGGHTSGDLFIAFATGNDLPTDDEDEPSTRTPSRSGRSDRPVIDAFVRRRHRGHRGGHRQRARRGPRR
jgi:hypothetical protein